MIAGMFDGNGGNLNELKHHVVIYCETELSPFLNTSEIELDFAPVTATQIGAIEDIIIECVSIYSME